MRQNQLDRVLERLRDNPRLWRGRRRERDGLPSGYEVFDRHLPDGGWPRQSLTEILVSDYGIGELQILMPALAALSRDEETTPGPRWIVWVAPPFQPYAPALKHCGIDLARLLVVHPDENRDVLWSAEQALASGTCAAVLLWPERLDDQAGRRLQLAAERGQSWAIAFRPRSARREPSVAALRIELEPHGQSTRVHILKSRGGRPAVIHNLFPV